MNLEKFLQDTYNYNPEIKDAIKTYMEQWKSWYVGNVKNFHNYFIYNGQRKVKQERYSMNMAKEISEDWSDILWSEKCEISMADENSQESFDELMDKLTHKLMSDNWIIRVHPNGDFYTSDNPVVVIDNDKLGRGVWEVKADIGELNTAIFYPLTNEISVEIYDSGDNIL